ncbi:testis-expressed basic protein 1-like [Lycaon pictus]
MAVLEITLAVILTLLGLAILAILLTRWTRRKQNEIDVSRYSSEQSAGLLDYEDGRGFRRLYSTESDASYDDQEGSKGDYTPSTNSLALSRSSIGEQRVSTPGTVFKSLFYFSIQEKESKQESFNLYKEKVNGFPAHHQSSSVAAQMYCIRTLSVTKITEEGSVKASS